MGKLSVFKRKGYGKMSQREKSEEKKEIQEKVNYCLHCKTSPCRTGCPLENDIPSFIKAVKQGEVEKAYQILSNTTVLSSICGRICPHRKQCQGNCIRGIKGEPASIGEIEAYIGDVMLEDKDSLLNCYQEEIQENRVNNEKKIAVIGGGPAGLTAAAYLARKGYTVTIFEREEKLGGILEYGIPEFRLDKEILAKTIAKIIALGIKVETGKALGKDYTLGELEENYDAIFLGIGANIASEMGIEGEKLEGVYGGNQLLAKGRHPEYEGKIVAVIGGGNVAMDAARTIKRLGAKEVKVIYRRAEKQMPAEKKEIEDAKAEGIEFLFQNNVVKILGNKKGKVEKVECIKTKLIKKEGETREVPVNIEGSNYVLPMDYVVMAVGSKPEEKLIQTLGLECNKWGYIQVNENYQTSKEKVFAGGDLAGFKATVAWAAKTGREAAKEIDRYISKIK